MKVVILFVLLVAVIVDCKFQTKLSPSPHLREVKKASADECTVATCVDRGNKCTSDYINSQTCGANETCCSLPMVCIDGSCVLDTLGDSCRVDDDCFSVIPEPLKCIQNVCKYMYSANDFCSSNSDCLGAMNCTNGRCKGLPSGAPCSFSYITGNECEFGYYCGNDLNCTSFLKNGENCSDSSNFCEVGTICSFGVCTPIYQGNEGSRCSNYLNCKEELACINNTCTVVPAFQKCDSDAKCGEYATCNCTGFVDEKVCFPLQSVEGVSFCVWAFSKFYSCLQENECYTPSYLLEKHPQSCAAKKCGWEMNNILGCECIVSRKFYGNNCFVSEECTVLLLRIWEIIVISIAILLFIVLLFIVICCWRRSKRHKYEKF